MTRAALLALALALPLAPTALARVLEVGPGRAYATPGLAAAAAQDGDTVAIAPGEYFDCAIWHASNLTVSGPGAVLTDRACEGKAAFVVRGDNVTLRGLTFTRIRVPDGNGAGVRGEGRDLTVIDSRFVNDQDGILAAGGGFLHVEGCSFTDGGSPGGPPTHAVLAGGPDELRVAGSSFGQARGGDHIAATARRIVLEGNRLEDAGRIAGPLATLAGESIALIGNSVALDAAARPGGVLVTGDVVALTVRGNTLSEPAGATPLVRNWGGAAAVAADNAVPPGVAAVSDSGSTYHRLRGRLAALREALKSGYRMTRHAAAALARQVM